MLPRQIEKRLVKEIKEELQPAFVILFGSFAKETSNNRSDIDIAYFSEKQLSNYERFIFANKLSSLVKREVDLVDIMQIDTVFAAQIFSEGVPIYIGNENTLISQRMRILSMYVTLNEQRAPIIEAIKESGRVLDHE